LTSIDDLKKEIISLDEESEKLKSELESFKPDRERLRQALKAAELDGNYATLTAVRKEQQTDQKSLKTHEGKLPELESSTGQKEIALKKGGTTDPQSKEGAEDCSSADPKSAIS